LKVRIGLLALVASLLAACASTLPEAPKQAAQADYKYLIGPGDILNINVWRNPELTANVPVRPDGRITIPLVEDMVAIGKDPTALAREIEAALHKFIQDPIVTVVVATAGGGSSQQVRVVGQAARPTTLPYRQNMTLLDVMIAVGGLTDFAAGNRAVLVRGREDNKAYNVRLDDLIKRGDVGANIQVLPGDVIIVPESWF
jgi:polysaccharide export outer membrane protein